MPAQEWLTSAYFGAVVWWVRLGMPRAPVALADACMAVTSLFLCAPNYIMLRNDFRKLPPTTLASLNWYHKRVLRQCGDELCGVFNIELSALQIFLHMASADTIQLTVLTRTKYMANINLVS
eukprot:2240454-Amphidinium_carterae.1